MSATAKECWTLLLSLFHSASIQSVQSNNYALNKLNKKNKQILPNSYWIHHPKVQEVQEEPTNARDLVQPPARLPARAALCPAQLLAAAAARLRCAAAQCCVRPAVAKRRVEVWQPGNLGHAVDLSCGYPLVINRGWKIAELNGRFKWKIHL